MTKFFNIPFNDHHLGIELEEWEAGRVLLSAEVKPDHRNTYGMPHGGFIAAMIDIAASVSGVYHEDVEQRRRCITLSLSINYVGVAETDRIFAEGKVTRSGRKIFFSTTEVRDANGNLLATAQGSFKYVSSKPVIQPE